MCLTMGVVGLNTTAIGVASGAIADEFGISVSTLSWIVGGYLLTAASFSLVGGRLGDVLGRVRTFVLGVLILATGATIAALSPTANVLIVGRVVEGLGAALAMPTSIELIAAYPPTSGVPSGFRARGVVYAASFGIGPLFGGLLTDHVSWRAIFWVELVVLLAAAALVFPLFRIASRLPKPPTRDIRGAALTTLFVLVTVGGAFRAPVWGWSSAPMAVTAGLSILLGLALFRVESRTPHPLLHRGLLRNRVVLGANVATLAASIGMIGLVYFFNLFAQSAAAFDSTAVAVAVALVPFTGSMLLFAYIAGRLAGRVGYRGPVLVGLGITIGGFAWLSTTSASTTELALALPLTLCGIGAGIANAGLTSPAVLTEPRARLDEASGLLSLSRFVGSALAVALGTSTYLSVATRLPAATMARTGTDPGTLAMGGSAFQQAVVKLRTDLRGPFEAAAHVQTADAFATTMRVATAVLLVLTLLSVWLLRPGGLETDVAPDRARTGPDVPYPEGPEGPARSVRPAPA